MAGKGDDRAQGLAEQSLNTSVVPSTQSSPDHSEQGGPSAGNRSLIGNDQRKGLERTDPGARTNDKPYKP
jgi:hypothetical protein